MRFRLLTLLATTIVLVEARKCRPKAAGVQSIVSDDVGNAIADAQTSTVRNANQLVYFWPSLTEFDRVILDDAFKQIARRTCIRFERQEWKPWYHADRWEPDRPYVIIRKSRQYSAYTDNKIEGVSRTLLYISQNAFEQNSYNQSRGVVLDQLVRYMGLRRELLRPDASSYIQDTQVIAQGERPKFHPAQLSWPFDPESVTIPLDTRNTHYLTEYCPARNNADIGAGQRVGLLTKWDTVKLNSMYCPQIVDADPRRGPCVVPRKKDLDSFKHKVYAYKKLQKKN